MEAKQKENGGEKEKKVLLNIAKKPIHAGQSKVTYNPKTSRTYEKRPSLRMEKAFKNYLDNGGNERRAIIDAGYSINTAVKPQNVTATKAWEKLKEKHISKEKLTATHSKLLRSKNENVQARMVELGYKVHHVLNGENSDNSGGNLTITNIMNIFD